MIDFCDDSDACLNRRETGSRQAQTRAGTMNYHTADCWLVCVCVVDGMCAVEESESRGGKGGGERETKGVVWCDAVGPRFAHP